MKKSLVWLIMILLLCLAGCQTSQPAPTGSADANAEAEIAGELTLDDLYAKPITEGYADIRTLAADYSGQQAQQDGCFVMELAQVHNDQLYAHL